MYARPNRNVVWLAALAFLTVAGGRLVAQTPSETFSATIKVQVFQLEVVLTDRDRRPVPGLEKGDFRLIVEGEEIPIEFFSKVRDDQIIDSPGSEAQPMGMGLCRLPLRWLGRPSPG